MRKTGIRNRWLAAAAGLLVLFMAGCRTLPVLDDSCKTEIDRNCRYDGKAPQDSKRWMVLVNSKVLPCARGNETYHTNFLARAVESSTMKYFANLGWFRSIDTKNGASVTGVSSLAALGLNLRTNADYVLVEESSVTYLAKKWWRTLFPFVSDEDTETSHSKKSRGARVETAFRLIDVRTGQLLVGSKFASKSRSNKGAVRGAISASADANVRKFARLVSARYLPPGKVTETWQSGRYVKVDIGKNYLLDDADADWPATRVDFFEYERADSAARRDKKIVAHGTVLAVEKNEALIEVDAEDWMGQTLFFGNLCDYRVRVGHLVKISEESVDKETELE